MHDENRDKEKAKAALFWFYLASILMFLSGVVSEFFHRVIGSFVMLASTIITHFLLNKKIK